MIEVNANQIILKIEEGAYKRIGSGSGRRVYDLGNGYVAKFAKNQKGLAQNEAEYQISRTNSTDIIAKIIRVSKNYDLLIMEKAEKVKNISYVFHYYHVKSIAELFQLDNFKQFSSDNGLILSDFYRTSNWGMINGRPVIIDYGFTRSVKQKYYSFFNI